MISFFFLWQVHWTKKKIQLKSTQMYMYFRSKEITISCCKVSVNITLYSYRYLNERSGCLQYTCTHICNTGIFFFLPPSKKHIHIFKASWSSEHISTWKNGKNHFICGKIISCCQKVLSSHIKHKIFQDFYKAKQQNWIPNFYKEQVHQQSFYFQIYST